MASSAVSIPEWEDLVKLKVAELKELAKTLDVDISFCTKKEEIVQAFRNQIYNKPEPGVTSVASSEVSFSPTVTFAPPPPPSTSTMATPVHTSTPVIVTSLHATTVTSPISTITCMPSVVYSSVPFIPPSTCTNALLSTGYTILISTFNSTHAIQCTYDAITPITPLSL